MSDTQSVSLPDPRGYKVLCAYIEPEKTYASGLVKVEKTLEAEALTSMVLKVLKLGTDAYKDTSKYPQGPWCQEGDFVMCRAYSGTRFKCHDKWYVLINDDMVEAVVSEPLAITRL